MAQKLTKEEILKRFSDLYNGEYELVSEYTTNKGEATIKHKNCGNEFKLARLTRFFNQSVECPCPTCRHTQSKKLSVNDRKTEFERLYPGYSVIESTKSKDPAKFKCKKCGTEFIISEFGNAFLKNRFIGCPTCNKSKRGKHQQKGNTFKNFVKKISALLPNSNFNLSDTTAVPGYSLDIYFPDKNIALEFISLTTHSEKLIGKKYHENKRIACEDKGIRLIQVFEDEWLQHEKIILSKVSSILNIRKQSVIFARKCKCRKVEINEYGPFLDRNHVQGKVSLSAAYGLYYNDKLVALGGFNKLRDTMNKSGVSNAWDMIRYATDIDVSVIGGCGKIISEFIKTENCKYMKTLADLRWSSSTNNMYIKLGFTEINYVAPRYFYTDGIEKYPRFNYRKEMIKKKFPDIYDNNLTEFEMMDKTNLVRVWDAGKITYEKYF